MNLRRIFTNPNSVWGWAKTTVGVVFQEAVAIAFAALGADAAVKAGTATDGEESLAKGVVVPAMMTIAAAGTTGAVFDAITLAQKLREKDKHDRVTEIATGLSGVSKLSGAAGAMCAIAESAAATKLFAAAFCAGVAANALKAANAVKDKKYFDAAIATLQTAIAAYNATQGVPGIETGNTVVMYIAAGLEAASGALTTGEAIKNDCLSPKVTDLVINSDCEDKAPKATDGLLAGRQGPPTNGGSMV